MRARPIGTVANFTSDDFSVFFSLRPNLDRKMHETLFRRCSGQTFERYNEEAKPYTINLFGEALLCYVEILVNGLAHRCDCHVTF